MGAAYVGLCAYAANGKTIWPGITVLGQELGGLTVEEATTKLNSFINNATVELYLYNIDGAPESHNRTADYTYTLEDLGFHPDTRRIAQEAYDMNVTEPDFYTLGWRYLTGEGETEYNPVLELDEEAIAQRAAETAEALSYPTTETEYWMDEETLTVKLPTTGRSVAAEDVAAQLSTVLDDVSDFSKDAPYTVLEPKVVTARDIHDEVYLPVQNAYYDKKARAAAPGKEGLDFDIPTAQAAMEAGLPGTLARVSLIRGKPTITYSHLVSVMFRDVLGSASTHVSGSAARVSNVRLAASAINGAVINAGEVFSYNGTVGQRTAAKGYKEAPAYVQGETVNEIGGGVCQPSSTLYLACLRSNMQITERYAHRYIPAYIKAGMDATVSWGGPDYKFTNNTDYPVKIQTGYNSSTGYLTITLIGTKTDDTYVEMTNEFISTTPWKTEYRTDKTLPVGTSKVISTPYTGYRYNTYRNVYDGNGKLISSKFEAVSDYKVRNQVIARNPG